MPSKQLMASNPNSIVGLHIEPTNICTLKCPGCPRTQFIKTWAHHWTNKSIDVDQLFKFLDIDLTDIVVQLCGNDGDPIYHPEFIDMVSRFKDKKSNLIIITNGSYKSRAWWEELASLLTAQDRVIFSIDGLPSNFTNYRINADWNSIKDGIDVCARADCSTVWKYIPFNFNEDDIQEAEALSKELAMDKFIVDLSSRFDKSTIQFKPRLEYVGADQPHKESWRPEVQTKVNPRCKNKKEHFISAAGVYTPCCNIGDYRFFYKSVFSKDNAFNIADTTLSSILSNHTLKNFIDNVNTNQACNFFCGGANE